VRDGKGVVDIHVAQFGQFLRKRLVVFVFAGMEAQILQQDHVARFHGGHGRKRFFTDAVVDEGNVFLQKGGKHRRNRFERKLFHSFALGTPQVGRHDDAGAFFANVIDGV